MKFLKLTLGLKSFLSYFQSSKSPPHYMYNPIKTIKTSSIGTLNMLGLAKRVDGRVLLASTSEIYGRV